ncbi:Two-component response regulator ORR42, partial [Dichanthelium oligosanthes]
LVMKNLLKLFGALEIVDLFILFAVSPMAFKNQRSVPSALVIEDIKVDCVILLRMLQKLNCEATVARNGKEAVGLFLQGKTFDIVFSDKDMPVMTGPEAVAKIRAMGITDVKIVGISADFGGMEAFMQAGADVFVPKPMKLETLDSIVQEVIHKKNMSI